MKRRIVVHLRNKNKNVLCGANYGGNKGIASIPMNKDFIRKVYEKPNHRICFKCNHIFKKLPAQGN
jgi:hypothetical protein